MGIDCQSFASAAVVDLGPLVPVDVLGKSVAFSGAMGLRRGVTYFSIECLQVPP